MAWRDEIAGYAEAGDTEGVLQIFDELWSDRQRVRTLNAAYLQRLGGKSSGTLEACASACAALTDAMKRLKATL